MFDYSSRIATYVTVSSQGYSGGLGYPLALPAKVIDEVRGVSGVQTVYSFKVNATSFLFHNVPDIITSPNGTKSVSYIDVHVGLMSAPMGEGYFPSDLVSLVHGRAPQQGEGGLVANCDGSIDPLNHSPLMTGSNYTVDVGGSQFPVRVTGTNAINYLYAGVCVLWNPLFLVQKLGLAAFNSTFGGDPNFVIVKVDSLDNVERVVSSLRIILRDFPDFVPVYDEAALVNLQNLQQETSPLYHLVGLLGITSAAAITLFAALLSTGRRSWEAGLLVSQGWGWRKIFRFIFSYYGVISVIAFSASTVISVLVSIFTVFNYWVYGTRLSISTPLSGFYLLSSLALGLLIAAVIALFESARFRMLDMERTLKDY
jgi:hypothetical protein